MRVWGLLTLASLSVGCEASGGERPMSVEPEPVVSVDSLSMAPTVATALALRSEGPEGLRKALELYDAADRSDDPQGWETFVDAVAGARDSSSARLFWETDLDRAKAEAKRRGLPILSLRMLGDLRDELSCANSRFFRTTLYPDPEVSRVLRESFVLHWSSERDVPVVEITFGDGRAIKTTTTGNSIHYLLDADGMVLDAAPGLYSPGGFSRVLADMQGLARDVRENGPQALTAHHERARRQGEAQMATWLERHGPPIEPEILPVTLDSWLSAPVPEPESVKVRALDAQMITASKSIVEVPTLKALGAPQAPAVPREQALGQVFTKLAKLGTVPVSLSAASRALIRRDRPATPGELESEHEARLSAMTLQFRSTIAEDELRNEYDLRLSLRRWLAVEAVDRSFEAFNERVYRDLFLTPASDPWLGLVDNATYDGLVEAGITRVPG